GRWRKAAAVARVTAVAAFHRVLLVAQVPASSPSSARLSSPFVRSSSRLPGRLPQGLKGGAAGAALHPKQPGEPAPKGGGEHLPEDGADRGQDLRFHNVPAHSSHATNSRTPSRNSTLGS